jgi:hypothetical protein
MSSESFSAGFLRTPFVVSWVGRARSGDRLGPSSAARSAAWAHWAVSAAGPFTGASGRQYTAIALDGRFHDPRGNEPLLSPHLEIPATVLGRPDCDFPDRVAEMGNGLSFGWWLPSEATAAKRALWNTSAGSVGSFVESLRERRQVLEAAMIELCRAAHTNWDLVDGALSQSLPAISDEVARPFSSAEVSEFVPSFASAGLTVRFDSKLRKQSGAATARRVGVWQISGLGEEGKPFSLGVITPRLTRSSQFHDPHFAIERESSAALLVRGLLLRRLLVKIGAEIDAAGVVSDPKPTKVDSFLRAVVPRVGDKIPEASAASAALFVQTHEEEDDAWDVLSGWAERSDALLTVREESFRESFRRVAASVRKAEEFDRDDINTILPLAWDSQQRVVRLTFARRRK